MYTLTQFDTIYDKDTTKVHTYQNLEDFEKVFRQREELIRQSV